jgi:hypothetical protein
LLKNISRKVREENPQREQRTFFAVLALIQLVLCLLMLMKSGRLFKHVCVAEGKTPFGFSQELCVYRAWRSEKGNPLPEYDKLKPRKASNVAKSRNVAA